MSNSGTTSEAMWQALSNELRAFLRSRLPSDDDADDALQDVFVRVQEKVGTVRQVDRVPAWIYQVARNAIVDFYRRRLPTPSETAEESAVPACSDDNSNEAVARWLPLLLEGLPETSRDAVRLFEMEGRSQQEIASELGISLSAAKSRILRGRQQLAELLRQTCQIELDRRGNVVACQPTRDDSCGSTGCGCQD